MQSSIRDATRPKQESSASADAALVGLNVPEDQWFELVFFLIRLRIFGSAVLSLLLLSLPG
jgi:fructose-1,6-bisphosphatase/inositol monophosphatase family enzyme